MEDEEVEKAEEPIVESPIEAVPEEAEEKPLLPSKLSMKLSKKSKNPELKRPKVL